MNLLFHIIMEWIILPLIELFARHEHSGRWHITHLFPVATAVGFGIWWLGEHWDSMLVTVLGVLAFVVFGFLSLVTLVSRRKGADQDFRDRRRNRASEAEVAESLAKVDARKKP